MKSSVFAAVAMLLLSLSLFASIVDARKDPGEYWQGLVDQATPLTSLSSKKHDDCHTPTGAKDSDDHGLKKYSKEFEPVPNISAYSDEGEPENEEKYFTKNFEPRPNISAYDDSGVAVKGEETFNKSFEPRPNISNYQD